MQYQQKDLGYPRAKTDAKIRVTFPCGDVFDVPLQIVADSRDVYYRGEKMDTVSLIRNGREHASVLGMWLRNQMRWSDVDKYAVKADVRKEPDYDNDFPDVEYEIPDGI